MPKIEMRGKICYKSRDRTLVISRLLLEQKLFSTVLLRVEDVCKLIFCSNSKYVTVFLPDSPSTCPRNRNIITFDWPKAIFSFDNMT